MYFDQQTSNFYLKDGERLDVSTMQWSSGHVTPKDCVEISFTEAFKKLQAIKGKIRLPVGVIGGNKPTPEQFRVAEELGQAIASLGLSVICGGKAGIMEAVCKGVSKGGGVSIGMLPETTIEQANEFVTIPLATSIGVARNVIIAASSLCLIAVGGGYGTLSEIAYGLQFGKSVFSINSNLSADGIVRCNTVEELVDNLCKVAFNIKPLDENLALNSEKIGA